MKKLSLEMLTDSTKDMELAHPGPGRSPSHAAPEAWSPTQDHALPLGGGTDSDGLWPACRLPKLGTREAGQRVPDSREE